MGEGGPSPSGCQEAIMWPPGSLEPRLYEPTTTPSGLQAGGIGGLFAAPLGPLAPLGPGAYSTFVGWGPEN